VAKNLLIARGDFWTDRLAEGPAVELADVRGRDRMVKTYLRFVESGKFICEPPGPSKDQSGKEYDRLCEAFHFGLQVHDCEFMNLAIDATLCEYRGDMGQTLPASSTTKWVFGRQKYQMGFPLRKLLADMWTWGGDRDGLLNNAKSLPQPFLTAIMSRLAAKNYLKIEATGVARDEEAKINLAAFMLDEHVKRRQSREIPVEVKSCDYHVHEKGIECNSRKRKREADEAEEAAKRRATDQSRAQAAHQKGVEELKKKMVQILAENRRPLEAKVVELTAIKEQKEQLQAEVQSLEAARLRMQQRKPYERTSPRKTGSSPGPTTLSGHPVLVLREEGEGDEVEDYLADMPLRGLHDPQRT
jgi:hypothetical protein